MIVTMIMFNINDADESVKNHFAAVSGLASPSSGTK